MVIAGKYYLWVGRARELKNPRERRVYRAFEMLPGVLVWLTFGLVLFASWRAPVATAFFIIAFDIYWFLRAAYFSLHLRASFRKMREYQKIDWLAKLRQLPTTSYRLQATSWEDLWHLVILPFYKEPWPIIQASLEGLVDSGYPRDRMIVVLSGEERGGSSAREIGERAQAEFARFFASFHLTFHPDGISGELRGKGANETWAAKEVKRLIIDPQGIPYQRIIASVFDVDTVVFPGYFARLAYAYLTTARPLHTAFQPIPLYTNNIWEAPTLSRIMSFSSTFWNMMNQARPERLVSFSSHSLPFQALVDMGLWQTNVVSEDSRIFFQALLSFDGDWRVEPLLFPVSMDSNVAETFWRTAKHIYLQKRRYAYGCENIPYFLFGCLKNHLVPLRAKFYWTMHLVEGFWSWATNSIIIFFLGWLPLLVGGDRFRATLLAYSLPTITSWVMTFAMIGAISSVYLSMMLLPPRPPGRRRLTYLWMALEWIFLSPTLVAFGSLPAIDAQTRLMLGKYMGFWHTPKVRKSQIANGKSFAQLPKPATTINLKI